MQSLPPYSHYDLAVLCDRVYDKPDSELLSFREVDCLMKRRGDTVSLSFRGTQAGNSWPIKWSMDALSNTRDFIRDLRAWPWRCPVSRQMVHKGFGISAYWWWEKFHGDLPTARYVISGHSLGAAIAPLVGRIMILSGVPVYEVVVFGEPSGHYFGSADDYRSIGINTTSYAHDRDPIRRAGFGSISVPATVITSRGLGYMASHSISEYAESLRLLQHGG